MPDNFNQNFQEQPNEFLNQPRWGWPNCPPCPPCRCDCRQCWGNNWWWNQPGNNRPGQGNRPGPGNQPPRR